jgi:hypothetical protein
MKQAVFFRTVNDWWNNVALVTVPVASKAAAFNMAEELGASMVSFGGRSFRRYDSGWGLA